MKRVSAKAIIKDIKTIVNALITRKEMSGISIAPDYHEYHKLAVVIYSECGEAGRSYYHRLCSIDSKYNEVQCDKEFNKVIKYKYTSATKGTLIYKMREYGII
tara:strand:+ start:300 stop:608 length:309 start_codon:yes stop_codon:yes gene_type:complete